MREHNIAAENQLWNYDIKLYSLNAIADFEKRLLRLE